MGACEYFDIEFGKTPEDAYLAAVDEAHYMYGHDTYAGTIGQSSGYLVIDVPKGWSIQDVQDLAWYQRDSVGWGEQIQPLPVRRKFATDWERTNYLDARKLVAKFLKLPYADQQKLRRVVLDKGGYAYCMELPAKDQREMRERNPRHKGKKGRYYAFFGLAPC
jgi:hypothetical protein